MRPAHQIHAGFRHGLLAAVLAASALGAAACASETPLERLQRELDPFAEYSVILQDMRPEGFYHQYRVVVGEPDAGSSEVVHRETVLDWLRVGRRTYIRYQSHLGMVILSKGPDGVVDQQQHPPGYQQVGDERYGRWRDDGNGRSFWEFYGQYALLSTLMGGFNRPVYRGDWDSYRDSRSRGQTYYVPAARTARTVRSRGRPIPTSSAGSRRARPQAAGRSATACAAACWGAAASAASSVAPAGQEGDSWRWTRS